MIPLEDVQRAIDTAIEPLDEQPTAVADATGLVLGRPVVAAGPVPPFANTAVDGYALRSADTEAVPDVELRVVGELPAGAVPSVAVGPDEAIRIMTGAPMPDGADAVVMVEDTRSAADRVRILRSVRPGQNVRDAGGDLAAGATAFEAGTVVGPAHLGVFAALDVAEVPVVRRAVVGVCSTGAELVERGPLAPGQIRDANRPMLLALVEAAGASAVDLGIVADDRDAVAARLAVACARCDVVITSGGVSVGDHDHVKAVLAELATGPTHWWQVAIKPAKPLAFAMVDDTPVFGLPGNPVSSLVSFELFARPAILGRMGYVRRRRSVVHATAAEAMPRRADGKVHFDRVIVRPVGDDLVATRAGEQGSNVLSAAALSNGLAVLPDGPGVAAGDRVRVMRLDGPVDR